MPLWTPGPWEYRTTKGELPHIFSRVVPDIDGSPNCLIVDLTCRMRQSTDNPAETDANAMLMAAAPMLMEGCSRAVPWLGKLITEGVHKNCAMPNDVMQTLKLIEAARKQALGDYSGVPRHPIGV